MKQYIDLVKDIKKNGVTKDDRTGTGTISVHNREMRFDMNDGFPLLSTKHTPFRPILNEFLWMVVHGSTDVTWLNDKGHTFWDAWKLDDGTIGKGYGHQFRNFGGDIITHQFDTSMFDLDEFTKDVEKGLEYIKNKYDYACRIKGKVGVDQVQSVIDSLKNNPDSRRHIINLWNPVDLKDMSLPPCHGIAIQFHTIPMTYNERIEYYCKINNVRWDDEMFASDEYLDDHNVPTYKLDLFMRQRSCDVMLGVPFNIGFYSIMLHVFSQIVNMVPNEFVWHGGDCHIYLNHMGGVEELINRWYYEKHYNLPTLVIDNSVTDINDFKEEHFELLNYDSHPRIKFKVAV